MSSTDDLTYKKILGAAQSLVDEVGTTFTMAQLEARATVSRATIYRRIGNKEMLLRCLAEERGERFEKHDVKLTILKAARALFGRQGLASVTMEQIANEANVGVATVYRHFGDKEGLLHMFVDEMTPRTAVRELTHHPTNDVAADLRKIVGTALPFFYENRDILRLVFMGGEIERHYLKRLRTRSDSTLGWLTNYFQHQQEAQRLKREVRAEDLALALIGLILAFTIIGPLHYNALLPDAEEKGQLIVALFLNSHQGE